MSKQQVATNETLVVVKQQNAYWWQNQSDNSRIKKKPNDNRNSPDAIYRALSNWIGIERHAHFYLTVIQKMCAYFLFENTKNGVDAVFYTSLCLAIFRIYSEKIYVKT